MVIRLTDAEAKRLGIPSDAKKSSQTARPPRRKASGKLPQQKLYESCKILWPDCEEEFTGVVPGRKFRIDIAFPSHKLATEIDGWEWHGKHKGDFQRDRERQNLLSIQGWTILRFTAKDIHQDLPKVLETIQRCLDNIERRSL